MMAAMAAAPDGASLAPQRLPRRPGQAAGPEAGACTPGERPPLSFSKSGGQAHNLPTRRSARRLAGCRPITPEAADPRRAGGRGGVGGALRRRAGPATNRLPIGDRAGPRRRGSSPRGRSSIYLHALRRRNLGSSAAAVAPIPP